MSHLKFLKLGGGVKFSGSLNYLSNQLGYLIWEEYPFQCLPPCFQPEQLVQLSLRESNIKQLWEGKKPLHNLKRLDLSYSQNLIDTPNFGEALNLEILCLEGCTQLRQMDPSIGLLRKLTFLNLTDCKSLVCLPNNILELNSLEFLSLSGCSKLYNILSLNKAKEGEHSKKLCIRDAPMNSHSTWSIMKSWFISPLQLLYSKAHKDSITCLPPSSLTFPCMRHLDLCFCNLLHVPDAIGNLHFLETLRLMGNNFATLPSLKELSKLNELDLQHCKRLKYLPELPSQTNVLSVCYWQSRSFQKGFLLHLVEAVLKIFNCPELVERERCSSMCFSWMMQIVQANYPYECGENCCWLWPPHISSIIPGSEIPRWFNNQYEGKGNFIYIDTSHFMHHDKNWIGVACSVIFVIPKQRGICPLEKEQKSIMSLRLHYRVDLITDELDHMFLFYFNRKHFIRACTLDHPLRTYPGDLKLGFQIGENECYVEVKKYGYRLLYKEDLQQNSLFRKRKCEAIERT